MTFGIVARVLGKDMVTKSISLDKITSWSLFNTLHQKFHKWVRGLATEDGGRIYLSFCLKAPISAKIQWNPK